HSDDAAVFKRNQAKSVERLAPDRTAVDHRAIQGRETDARSVELEYRHGPALLAIEDQRRLAPLQKAQPAAQQLRAIESRNVYAKFRFIVEPGFDCRGIARGKLRPGVGVFRVILTHLPE